MPTLTPASTLLCTGFSLWLRPSRSSKMLYLYSSSTVTSTVMMLDASKSGAQLHVAAAVSAL